MADISARIDSIRQLAEHGLTAAEIAARMGDGETRSSVLGICNRHGVKLARAANRRKEPKPADARAASDDALPRRAIPQQQRDGCRWPLWGDREAPTHVYCGGRIATPGRPYCAEHERRSRSNRSADQAAAEGLSDPRAKRAGTALDGLADGEAA